MCMYILFFQMHPSIMEEGDRLKCTTVSPSVFACPVCPKFTTKSESVVQRHLLNHAANAVHFKGMFIKYLFEIICLYM